MPRTCTAYRRLAVGGDGKAADEPLLLVVLLAAGGRRPRDRDRARDGQTALLFRQLVHRVLRGARGIEPLAVRVPREPEPGVVHRDRVADVPLLEIHHRQRRLLHAVVRDDEGAAVGALEHGEGKVSDRDVAPGGGDLPAVGEEHDAAALAARLGGLHRPALRGRVRRQEETGGQDHDKSETAATASHFRPSGCTRSASCGTSSPSVPWSTSRRCCGRDP